MSAARLPPAPRAPQTARTRTCPHCKATILESASVCPGCRHHLRFDPVATQREAVSRTAMRIEGTIQGPTPAVPCEYCVVIAIRDEQGREVHRQVVGVGALQPAERRGFTLSVDIVPPPGPATPRRG